MAATLRFTLQATQAGVAVYLSAGELQVLGVLLPALCITAPAAAISSLRVPCGAAVFVATLV